MKDYEIIKTVQAIKTKGGLTPEETENYFRDYINKRDNNIPLNQITSRTILIMAFEDLIWYVINWAINNSSRPWYENAVFKELNRTSYGIYVLHYWLQPMLLSSTAKRLLHLETLAANHVIIFPLFFFLSSLTISYVGTKFLLKTKVGRFLIG